MINLTYNEINKKIKIIQESWADGIIKIGLAYQNKQDFISQTDLFLTTLYNFDKKKVLFKPTKARDKQFRKDKSEFISYFIGHNKVSNEDTGFALEPWKDIKFDNFDFIVFQDIIITIGNYYFTNYEGETIKVEYSFGYTLDKDENKLRIVFHHSSIPYSN